MSAEKLSRRPGKHVSHILPDALQPDDAGFTTGGRMASEMLERQDLSVYVVAGVPKSFKKKLQKFVETESKSEGDVMLLDEEMTDWVLARVRGEKRRSHEQTPASSALWRAYRALSAARYHLQDQPIEGKIRTIRDEIEGLWRDTSPLHEEPEEEALEEVI